MAALDQEGVSTIVDLLGSGASYTALRERLVGAYERPRTARCRELVTPGGIGDRRPSQLLRDMRNSVPAGISEDALFWMQKLPSNVLAIVASLEGSLDSLASRADRVTEALSPQGIDAALDRDTEADVEKRLSALSQSMNVQESSQRKLSRQEQSTTFYYHRRYGNKARKCRSPCDAKRKSGRRSGSTSSEN